MKNKVFKTVISIMLLVSFIMFSAEPVLANITVVPRSSRVMINTDIYDGVRTEFARFVVGTDAVNNSISNIEYNDFWRYATHGFTGSTYGNGFTGTIRYEIRKNGINGEIIYDETLEVKRQVYSGEIYFVAGSDALNNVTLKPGESLHWLMTTENLCVYSTPVYLSPYYDYADDWTISYWITDRLIQECVNNSHNAYVAASTAVDALQNSTYGLSATKTKLNNTYNKAEAARSQAATATTEATAAKNNASTAATNASTASSRALTAVNELQNTTYGLSATKTKLDDTYQKANAAYREANEAYNAADSAMWFAYDAKNELQNTTYGLSATKTKLDSTYNKAEAARTQAVTATTEATAAKNNASTAASNAGTASSRALTAVNELQNTTYGLSATKTKLDDTHQKANEAYYAANNAYYAAEDALYYASDAQAFARNAVNELQSGTYGLSATKTKLDSTYNKAEAARTQALSATTEATAAKNNASTAVSELQDTTYGLNATKTKLDSTYSKAEAARAQALSATSEATVAKNNAALAIDKAQIAVDQTIHNGQSAAQWAYLATLDTAPPTINEVKGRNEATCTTSGTFYVVVNATDNKPGQLQAQARVGEGAWTGWVSIPQNTIAVALPSVGAHTITVNVKDAAGNISTSSMTAFRI